MVGLTEQYERSTALFEAIFSKKFPRGLVRVNTNPDRQRDAYEIEAVVKKAVDRYCSADVELYQRAREMFLRLACRFDV